MIIIIIINDLQHILYTDYAGIGKIYFNEKNWASHQKNVSFVAWTSKLCYLSSKKTKTKTTNNKQHNIINSFNIVALTSLGIKQITSSTEISHF